ncbi:hypothetical protein [Dulcicalothrix desertica]|nr:hypothetical protein [Dulcicalothrix desertica]
MPSEQTTGRPVFSSDLYSLGLTAIYLLTGKYPQELATNPSTGEILWRQYALNITPSFAAILDKAIQPYAPNRYKNASLMLRSLQNLVAPKIQPNPTLISAAPTGAYVQPQQTPTVVVAPSQAIPYQQPANAQGMNDWQKALVMGGVIGVCVLGGLLIIDRKDNTQPQTTVVQQSTSVASTTSLPTQERRLSQPLVSRTSAGQALRNYYETINRSEYQSAWSQLSPQHRNNPDLHPAGFNSFTE